MTASSSKTFQLTAARRRLGGAVARALRRHFVSTHSRPKAAGARRLGWLHSRVFQLTAARRRLEKCLCDHRPHHTFQLTAARRRLAIPDRQCRAIRPVSTHSRPKAAGIAMTARRSRWWRFNSQPPEGGWETATARPAKCRCFNSQPPEGGWCRYSARYCDRRGFNSQPPEGGWEHAQRFRQDQ